MTSWSSESLRETQAAVRRLCLPAIPLRLAFFRACADPPRTVAETSDYKATSRYADVVEFGKHLAKESPLVRLGSLGRSHEGRDLPLIILADPPVASPEEAANSKKLVVFAMANIHAGEVDGKEALLMLARDWRWRKIGRCSRTWSSSSPRSSTPMATRRWPRIGHGRRGRTLVGIRANAQEFDLNRDFVKLESPEVRALVRLLQPLGPCRRHRLPHDQRLVSPLHD